MCPYKGCLEIKIKNMRRRNLIIIIILLISITAYAVFSFTKKPEPKYTTVKTVKGEVVQTVSATGTVEAEKSVDLRFVNSGKIKEINVKMGDKIEEGTVLAKLETAQLESQLAKAKAGLNAAAANLNQLLAGASVEDIRVSETAVRNAEIVLDNARQSLTDVQEGAEKDIASAEASVTSAQVVLNNANQSLTNTQISSEDNLNQDYDDAWDTLNSALLIADNSLDTNQTVLNDEDAQDTLSVLNTQYLNNSSQSKAVANNSYDSVKNYIDSIKPSPAYEEIDEALVEIKSMLEYVRDTLSDTSDVLQATITSSKLSQTELDVLKSSVSSARSNTNTAISNITTATQNISSQKITNQTNLDSAQSAVNSAESSLSSAEKSLTATQSSATSKINSAQGAVDSAEGSLKQARDQLALKKAGPRSSEVSLYQARVREARANVNLIESQISDSIIIAPRAGIAVQVNGEVGELANPAATFISLIAPDDFEIKANISEVDIAKVKISDPAEITFDALGLDKKFKGNIAEIDPAQTEISGVIYYKITVVFAGDSEIIKPGMTANLDIITAEKDNVIMVPFQALKEKNGRKYVQVLKNGVAKDVFVEVGLRGDVDLEIVEGLVEGEEVVIFMEE